jgi:Rps23 Pro-64 3,4-dihydroxylase Tpa1-like proline 4-hydroxylase
MEIKIIYLDNMPRLGVQDIKGNIHCFDSKNLENTDSYIPSMIGNSDKLTLNLVKRSSFTFNKNLRLENPIEFSEYFNSNSILQGSDYANCEILKYEVGDFFVCHRDTIMSDPLNKGEHKYTCLIYGTFEQENGFFEGGELIFKHPEGLYNIEINLSDEIKKNKYIAVIFSVNMYHEVLPVKNVTRYCIKKPLFVKAQNPVEPMNVDMLEGDGGFQSRWSELFGSTGDY